MSAASRQVLPALALAFMLALAAPLHAQADAGRPTPPAPVRPVDARTARLKEEAVRLVEARAKQVQEIVDMLFSFQELGFQEFESMKYLTGILEKEGVGSSRVDLQACKLEYSIVSPK